MWVRFENSRPKFGVTPLPKRDAPKPPIFGWFYDDIITGDTSRHAVTLTFDPQMLNVCSVSAVTWSNFVPNFSKIRQSAAELKIEQLFPASFSRSTAMLLGLYSELRGPNCNKLAEKIDVHVLDFRFEIRALQRRL